MWVLAEREARDPEASEIKQIIIMEVCHEYND